MNGWTKGLSSENVLGDRSSENVSGERSATKRSGARLWARFCPDGRKTSAVSLVFVSLAMTSSLVPSMASAFPLKSQNSWGARLTLPVFDQGFHYNGIMALSNCSGSLIRFKNSTDDSPALLLTNGHCSGGSWGRMPKPGEVLTNVSRHFDVTLLDKSGKEIDDLSSDKIIYATMTDTDITLLELNSTYRQIREASGVEALVLADQHPTAGTAIEIASGYWNETYSCSIDGFVSTLKEASWTFHDSVRYSSTGCEVKGGTSGSPIISVASGQVIAINNTINENGQQCTLDNPCEVAPDGTITATQGRGYGQETYEINSCVNSSGIFDLTQTGCALPKPL